MKIIGDNNLRELMHERDRLRQEFINKEIKLKETFIGKHQQLKKKIRKFSYLWLYVFVGYILILLLLYKQWGYDFVKYGSIFVGLIILLFGLYPIILLRQKN